MTTIPQLPSASPCQITDALPIQQGALTAQSTLAQVATFMGANITTFAALAGAPGQTFSVAAPTETAHAMPWTNAPVNIWWYGAVGNGIADDTAAINAAIVAANGAGVYFPPPPVAYKISSPLIFGVSQRYFGSGLSPAIISTDSTTADIVQVTGSYIAIDGLCLTSSVTKTAGISLNIAGSYVIVDQCQISNFFTAIQMGQVANTAGVWISNTIVSHFTANGTQTGVCVVNGIDYHLHNVLITGQANHNLAYGILITNTGDVTLDHVQIIYGGDGITIAPQSGETVQCVYVTSSFVDTSSGNGIYIAPGNGGSVELVKFSHMWSCTNAAGIVLTASGVGNVQQVDCFSCVFSNNTGNGIEVAATGVTLSNFIGCSAGSNGTGFIAGTGVTGFKLIGCTIGQSGEFAGNTTGIILNGSNDGFSIVDNQVIENTTAMTMGTPAGGPGLTWFVARNHGVVTNNYGELITTAGPTSFTVTHGLAFTPGYEDITLTLGTGLGNATSFWLSAVTATTFTITFNAAPGASVGIFWRARIMGS